MPARPSPKEKKKRAHITLGSAIVCTDPHGCTTYTVPEEARDREGIMKNMGNGVIPKTAQGLIIATHNETLAES